MSAPHLKIVSEALWNEAHARLANDRGVYLRSTGGRLLGRPEHGVESKYLLPGIAKCAACGGNLIVRRTKQGRQRVEGYTCGSYHQRGRTVCPEGLTVNMATVDKAVLGALERQLLGDGMLEELLDSALARLHPSTNTTATDKRVTSDALQRVEAEIGNLTTAIAVGGNMTALLTALKAREAERDGLRRRVAGLAQLAEVTSVAPDQLRQRLRARLDDWRGVLRRQPQLARQMLKKLLAGPLTFKAREGFFEFEGTASLAKLIATSSDPILVASPPGSDGPWSGDIEILARIPAA